jgi:RluA family pseudouridine synthase
MDLESRLLYRDALLLVIDKPAGIAVHAGASGGDHLGTYLKQLRFGLPQDPELAHRLDRDTSGCLALGRHRKALAKLGKLFADGQVRKTYWAIVVGRPPQKEGKVDLPLLKETKRGGWKMRIDAKGQPSLTEYRTIGEGDGMTWLALEPRTGRTHQLRAHMAAIGCPILGDPIYGGAATRAKELPLQLHARALKIPLYPRREPIKTEAPVPDHMKANMRACGWKDGPRGRVVAVAAAPGHNFSKLPATKIELIAGEGVAGDGHAGVTVKHRSRVARDPTQPNLRQVHLIQSELFDELRAKGFDIRPGDIGENIATQGLDLLALPTGTRLRFPGGPEIEITGLRNPCAQLDNFKKGLTEAVLDRDANGELIRKAGVMAIVHKGGRIASGDPIAVDLPPEPHRKLMPV